MIRLTRQQVREVDRLAIEKYRIPGIVLMENAARGATEVAMTMLRRAKGRNVLILCGGGNNGGDGLAVARHLYNRGIDVSVGLCTDPDGYKGEALVNRDIVQAMRLPCFSAAVDAVAGTHADLIIDAIFGTGLSREPRPPFADLAEAVRQTRREVLAIDLPSGLDCNTGAPYGACIRATCTVTFVAEKAGFANPQSRQYTGRISVADIGCPPELIRQVLADSGSAGDASA